MAYGDKITVSGGGGTITGVLGTANRITVNTVLNVATVDISGSYVGQSSITTVGALSSGSLAAGFTPVTVPLGGTGNTTFTAYSLICGGTTATGTFQNVVGVGTAGQVLTSAGAAALPSWQNATGGVTTIDGDTGSATGSTITFSANPAAGSTVKFTASAAAVDLTTTDANDNVFIGDANGNITLTGTNNVCVGPNNMGAITTGTGNIGLGTLLLPALLSGDENIAFGEGALSNLTTGSQNYAIGSGALDSLITGSGNIAIGLFAGLGLTGAETNNILIGSQGVAADSGKIRIGTNGTHTSACIAGIDGVNLTTAKVVTESGDQLGTATITAGTGITIDTATPNQIIVNAVPNTFVWTIDVGSPLLVVNNGYFVTGAFPNPTYILPAGTLGDVIKILLLGGNTFTLDLGAGGTTLYMGNVSGGNQLLAILDTALEIVCISANTWVVQSSIGTVDLL